MSDVKSEKELDQQVDNCCNKYRCGFKTVMNVIIGALFVFFCITIANYFKPDIFGSAKISITNSQDLSAFFNSYKTTIEAYHTTLLAIVALFSILGIAGAVLNMQASGKVDELTKELAEARRHIASFKKESTNKHLEFINQLNKEMLTFEQSVIESKKRIEAEGDAVEGKIRKEVEEHIKQLKEETRKHVEDIKQEAAEELKNNKDEADKQREISKLFAEAYNASLNKEGNNEAIKKYRKVLKINPEYAAAYYNLGIALSDIGKNGESIEAYRKAIEIEPDYAAAYYNLGIALRKSGDIAGAIEAYRKTLEIEPDDAAAYNNLGNALRESKDRAGAIEAYRKAIELEPEHADAYNNLSSILIKKEEYAEAQKLLLEDYGFDKNDFAYNLACLYALWSRSEKDSEAKPEDCLAEAEKYWRLAGENGQLVNEGVENIKNDADLDNIRKLPWFDEVMTEVFGKEWEEQKGKGNAAGAGDNADDGDDAESGGGDVQSGDEDEDKKK